MAALIYGLLLEEYSPGRLIRILQGTAVLTMALNLLAMWKQEARDRERAQQMETVRHPTFAVAWRDLLARPGMVRLLTVIGLGTFGFGMADVLLEPYGGQALGFSVAGTTRLTALLAAGTLIGFAVASRALGRGGSAEEVARFGALTGIPGFAAIIVSSMAFGPMLFVIGTLVIGIGAGLFGHATLTAAIRAAPRDRVGLSLGAWGGVQATCAGIGIAGAGIVRDLLMATAPDFGLAAATPYNVVFTLEIVFLLLAVLMAVRRRQKVGDGGQGQKAKSWEVS